MPRETGLAAPRERLRLRAWTVLGVGLGTAAFLGASMGGLYLYYARHAEVAAVERPTPGPAPRVQSDPAGDLRDLQALQRAQVEGYARLDEERGLFRIPVARAMAILAARGDAAFAPLEAPPEPGLDPAVRPEAGASRSRAGTGR